AVPAPPRRPQPAGMGNRNQGPRAARPRHHRPERPAADHRPVRASPAARVEFNRTYVGPTKAIFDRLDPAAQQTLAAELAGCLQQFNRATDGTLVAPAEYLQLIATRTAPAPTP